MILKSVHLYVLPMFFIPANIPAPRPIVPKEPKDPVILSITERRLFNPLTVPMIASEFAIFPITFVQVLERRFNEP